MKKFILTISTILLSYQSYSQEMCIDTSWIVDNENFHAELIHNTKTKLRTNTLLKIIRNSEIVQIDSILCTRLYIELKDMNNDKHKDLLIFQNSGARANVTYNLFLYSSISKSYEKVEEYNKWPNMNTTKVPGVFAACILTGTVEYRFFKLNKDNKLIDLNISEVDMLLDGKAYDRGILKVKNLTE